jgi:hypothetical protein
MSGRFVRLRNKTNYLLINIIINDIIKNRDFHSVLPERMFL